MYIGLKIWDLLGRTQIDPPFPPSRAAVFLRRNPCVQLVAQVGWNTKLTFEKYVHFENE